MMQVVQARVVKPVAAVRSVGVQLRQQHPAKTRDRMRTTKHGTANNRSEVYYNVLDWMCICSHQSYRRRPSVMEFVNLSIQIEVIVKESVRIIEVRLRNEKEYTGLTRNCTPIWVIDFQVMGDGFRSKSNVQAPQGHTDERVATYQNQIFFERLDIYRLCTLNLAGLDIEQGRYCEKCSPEMSHKNDEYDQEIHTRAGTANTKRGCVQRNQDEGKSREKTLKCAHEQKQLHYQCRYDRVYYT